MAVREQPEHGREARTPRVPVPSWHIRLKAGAQSQGSAAQLSEGADPEIMARSSRGPIA